MEEDLVGLDAGEDYVAACHLQRHRDGRVRALRLGIARVAETATPRERRSSLRRLWGRCRFPTRTVGSCLRSPSLVLKHCAYPPLQAAELDGVLRLDAEESLQMTADRLVLDWHPHLNGTGAAARNTVEGVLVASPRAEVDRHLAWLRSASLYPVVLDVGCTALANAFICVAGLPPPEAGCLCLVHTGRAIADVSILSPDGHLYPRTLLSRSGAWDRAIDYLTDSIRDAVKYCAFKLRWPAVSNIWVSGSFASNAALVQMVSHVTGVLARPWDPIRQLAERGVSLHADCEGVPAPVAAVCLGLALRRSVHDPL